MRSSRHTRTLRSGGALLLALVGVSLSGCLGMRDGGNAGGPSMDAHKSSEAIAELKEVPGVLDAVVTTGPNGLPSQIELAAGLNLEAGYQGDLPVLLDYTLAMAWSVTTEEPTTVVSVGFLDGETAVDLAPVAAELGWTGLSGPRLSLSVDDMAERYGDWPGQVPELPAELG